MTMANNTDHHITGTPPDDPLEALLQQAFTEQLSHPVDEAAVSKITARIAFEQKVRMLVMLGLIAVGAVFGVTIVLPAIAGMAGALSLPQIPSIAGVSPATAAAGFVLLGLAPWLIDLVDDHI